MSKRLCTVLIPFDAAGQARFAVLKQLGEALGFDTFRVAQYYSSGMIPEEIVRSIRDADLVIADLTAGNPNVYYETGIAHALGKRVFITAEDPGWVQVDLGGATVNEFAETPEARQKLAAALKAFVETPGCLSPIALFTGGSGVAGQRLILRRAGALFIDMIILMLSGALVMSPLTDRFPDLQWLPGSFAVGYFIAYFFFTTLFLGASPGQRLLRLKVIALDRSPPSVWQSLFRPVASIINLFTLGIALLWTVKPPRYQAVHDTLTRTLVIKTRTPV